MDGGCLFEVLNKNIIYTKYNKCIPLILKVYKTQEGLYSGSDAF